MPEIVLSLAHAHTRFHLIVHSDELWLATQRNRSVKANKHIYAYVRARHAAHGRLGAGACHAYVHGDCTCISTRAGVGWVVRGKCAMGAQRPAVLPEQFRIYLTAGDLAISNRPF